MTVDRRALLLHTIAGVAATPLLTASPPAQAVGVTEPRQGWAHKDGRIAMHAPSTVTAQRDPMAYLLLHEALSRYGIAHDELRFDVLSELFTDDALLEVGKGSGTPFQTVRGSRAIVANFANVLGQQGDQRRHCFTNVVIDHLDEGTAKMLAYGLVSVAADGLTLGATVFYQADCQKVAGNWRFTRLFIGMDDYTTPAPKV